MVQAHIFYKGQVQGVGFRYTIRRFASSFGLLGWVRNLYSGQVEVLIEGDKEIVESLLERIDEQFRGYIVQKDLTYRQSEGNFVDFKIKSTA